MNDKSETLQAIARLQMVLWDALQFVPPADAERVYKSAQDGVTGVTAIDDLLTHVDAEDGRANIEARWLFLGNVRDAMHELVGASGRGRKGKADTAGKNLRDAALSLRELGSDGLAQALEQLAYLVAARAHVSVIEVAQLSSQEIVPGTRLLARHTPHQYSAYFTSKRGTSSHRAELIRFVCHHLQASTPPTLIAALLTGALEVQCTHADVQQARGHQAQSIRDARASSSEAGLNTLLGKWPV